MPTNYQRGVWAETLACWLLRLKGYRILARRYKTPVGEIDIIARRGRTLVFVEVKTRQTIEEAVGAITFQSAPRLQRAAEHFLATRGGDGWRDMRFDLIALAPPLRIRHLDNIFMVAR